MPSETDDVLRSLHKAEAEEARRQLLAEKQRIERFIEYAACAGIELAPSNFSYVRTIGVVAEADDLAMRFLDSKFVEKDGLVSFDHLEQLTKQSTHRPGCFGGPEFMYMADPCFRRGMHGVNNWAPNFVKFFCETEYPESTKYLGIDRERIRIGADGPHVIEADTWYGAPFSMRIHEIPLGNVKLRPPVGDCELATRFKYADTYCLDILWSERTEGVKTFQALEIKSEKISIEIGGELLFPARYLHAEFDLASNSFRHFDGAVQFLTLQDHLARRDFDFSFHTKSNAHFKARSRKLFKLNGTIALNNWIELCQQFFPGNPLIKEYFAKV